MTVLHEVSRSRYNPMQKGSEGQMLFAAIMKSKGVDVRQADIESDRKGIDYYIKIKGVESGVAVSVIDGGEELKNYMKVTVASVERSINGLIPTIQNAQARFWAYIHRHMGSLLITPVSRLKDVYVKKYREEVFVSGEADVNKYHLRRENAIQQNEYHMRQRENIINGVKYCMNLYDVYYYPTIEEFIRDVNPKIIKLNEDLYKNMIVSGE